MAISTPTKLRVVLAKCDIRFHVYERLSLLMGIWSTTISKLIYCGRLQIEFPYRIWCKIRFLLLAAW
jgi:hypothetical protein